MSVSRPSSVSPDEHAACNVVRALYLAIGTADVRAILPLVQRPAVDAWYAALVRCPHDVWTLQEWRERTCMPVTHLPDAVEDGLRYVLEAIPVEERDRVPIVERVRVSEPGMVDVELSSHSRMVGDDAFNIGASPPFVVHVQHDTVDDVWRVVPNQSGAFPFPGLARGLVMAVVSTGPQADSLSLEVRVDYAADRANAIALEAWLTVTGCHVRAHDTSLDGWRALSVLVPAETMVRHGTTFVHTLCAFPVVRQVWRADEAC